MEVEIKLCGEGHILMEHMHPTKKSRCIVLFWNQACLRPLKVPCNQTNCWGTQWTPNGKQLIDLGPN